MLPVLATLLFAPHQESVRWKKSISEQPGELGPTRCGLAQFSCRSRAVLEHQSHLLVSKWPEHIPALTCPHRSSRPPSTPTTACKGIRDELYAGYTGARFTTRTGGLRDIGLFRASPSRMDL